MLGFESVHLGAVDGYLHASGFAILANEKVFVERIASHFFFGTLEMGVFGG